MKNIYRDTTQVRDRCKSYAHGMRHNKRKRIETAMLAAGLVLLQGSALAADGDQASEGAGLKLGGYVRTWASFNLNDQPDTPNYNDSGKPQMLRGSVSLTGDLTTGPLAWHAVVRTDREILTQYQKVLQDSVRKNTPGGPGSSVLNQYDRTDLRELFFDTDIGDRVHLRLGKQQVVWGETDLFHPTDLIQGFDYRWRFFLEPETDELRKPLILVNTLIKVPEANGALQVVVRPGLDRKEDIGNTVELAGGRWGAQPNKGVDFLTFANFDYNHPSSGYKDPTGGVRWTGEAGSINYSLSALRTFQPGPVLNPAADPYRKTPSGALGDFFFPKMNVYSASINGEVPAIDSVANAELAYQPGQLFNSGTSSGGVAGPVQKKNVIQTTVRIDKQLRLMDLMGTSGTSFSSLQIFDTWVRGVSGSDIVENVGYAKAMRSHTTVASVILKLPYLSGRLEPGILIARYLQSGDTLYVPSVAYSLGNHWRFVLEADIFQAKHYNTLTTTDPLTGGFGPFAQTSQLLVRATYQF